MIYNQITDFRETIDVRFSRTKIAAFDRIVKKTENAVAVVVVVLGRVDAALRRDRVRAPRRILEAEALDVVAKLSHGRGGGPAGGLPVAAPLPLPPPPLPLWLGPELWGSGNAFRASDRAQRPNPDSPAFADVAARDAAVEALRAALTPVQE